MDKMNFSKDEIRLLRIWGDTVINGGHWGDGQVLFPDEEMALDYIETLNPEEPEKLSKRLAKIFLIWAEKAAMISPEEQQLVERLKAYSAQKTG